MSTLSVRLPSSLHRKLKEMSIRDGVSMNQLISSAVGEKLASLFTEEYLAERAQRGNRKAFEAALRKVPDVQATPEDALPDNEMQRTAPHPRPKRRR
jgi:HicB family